MDWIVSGILTLCSFYMSWVMYRNIATGGVSISRIAPAFRYMICLIFALYGLRELSLMVEDYYPSFGILYVFIKTLLAAAMVTATIKLRSLCKVSASLALMKLENEK